MVSIRLPNKILKTRYFLHKLKKELPKNVTVPSTGGGSPFCVGGAIRPLHFERFRSFVDISPFVNDLRFSPVTTVWPFSAG